MKQLIFFIIISGLLTLSAMTDINLDGKYDGVKLIEHDEEGLSIECEIQTLSSFESNTQRGLFSELSAAGFSFGQETGLPKLPEHGELIAVPLGAEVEIVINDSQIEEFPLAYFGISNELMPVQPPLSKSIDPNQVEFLWDEAAYQMDMWYGKDAVSVAEIGILRGMRIFRLVYAPVKYNPVTGMIRIINKVDATVHFVGSDAEATEELRGRTWSPFYERIYGEMLFNYTRLEMREDITRYPIKYVIISDAMFTAQLQPFIEWKTQQGYEVIVAYTNAIGTSTTAIANYIEGLWDEATPTDPAPSFILFVGDTAQIPAYNGSQGSHVTDLNYVRLEGVDFMPEIYYGRFSARNVAELQPQIDKTLEYEMYQMPDPSYLGEVVMIAGVDANFSSTWANGQINYGTSNYFNAAHGISSYTYLYPASGSSAAQIVQNVSDGVGYVNYTAHGSSTSWSNPSFTINNINNLQNDHEYPLAVGNCCLTNKFEVGECFGEAWLREENGGAIGYIGGTNSTYWDEDFWWGVGSGNVTANPTYNGTGQGAYDGMFHDHGEDFEGWYTAQSAVIMAGNLAVVQAGGSMNYYWEIYSLMGDPSLMPYFGIPEENNVVHTEQIFIGSINFAVSAERYSYVGLTLDGELIASGITDSGGDLILEFPVMNTAGTAGLVVTCQNKEPYFAEIQVLPNAGAFLAINDYTINSDNGDENIDYGETIELSLVIENVGVEAVENVSALLAINDPYITLTNGTVNAGSIAAGATAVIAGFTFEVAENIPDGHEFPADFDFSYISGSNEATLPLTAYAGVLALGGVFITSDDNNNGRLDPGETCEMELEIINNGGSLLESIITMVSSASEYITVTNTWSFIPEISAGENGFYPFMVEVTGNCPVGESVVFSAEVTANLNQNLTSSFALLVGRTLEDFETGDFSVWEWELSGNTNWFVSNEAPYEGEYCAESGDIGNSQISTLSIELDVLYDDEISFWRKVSSEANWDFLYFNIDGEEMGSWSGSLGWSEASFPVSAGTHIFSWVYDKDGSQSTGSDCAWIDYITFPALGVPTPPEMSCSVTEITQTLELNSTGSQSFTIANTGGGTLYYYLSLAETGRNIGGSTFTCDAETYLPGETVTWNLEVYNNSGDSEWLSDIIVEFPPGVSVISATDFTSDSGNLYYNDATGNGISVEWNDPNGGWGEIYGGETANASVTVTIDDNFTGNLNMDWTLLGDDYGTAPHEVSGTLTLTAEIIFLEWVTLNQYSGILNGDESDEIMISFDSNPLEPGIYTANLIINDNREITIVPILLQVGGDISYGDIDDNGSVEALDASLVLQYSVGIDPAPFAPLPWEIWRLLRSDVDGNDMTEAFDASLILQYTVGIITEFPVEQGRREELTEPELDYRITADEIIFSSKDEVFSFLLLSNEQAALGKVEIFDTDMLRAVNNCDCFNVALATAEAGIGDIMSIHYRSGEVVKDLEFGIYLNGIYTRLPISAEELLESQLPQVTSLNGNYPNPFNPVTTIAYQLSEATEAKLEIYNLRGQKIITLLDSYQEAGKYSIVWNAEAASSGIYFYRLQAGGLIQTSRMILLK